MATVGGPVLRRPPAEWFARSVAADESAVAPAPTARPPPGRRAAGVSPWVNAYGKISLPGFSYTVEATYAGEPVEVVVADALGDFLHAGVVVATPCSGCATTRPTGRREVRVARRTPGRHRRADRHPARRRAGRGELRRDSYACGRRWARQVIDVTIVAGPGQLSRAARSSRSTPIRHDRSRELGAFANPKGRRRRTNSANGEQCRLATGTHRSLRYRYLTAGREREELIGHGIIDLSGRHVGDRCPMF